MLCIKDYTKGFEVLLSLTLFLVCEENRLRLSNLTKVTQPGIDGILICTEWLQGS